MTTFIGIFNHNGKKIKMRMYVDLKETGEYFTDIYMNDKILEAKIDGSKCTIYDKKQCNSLLSVINFICGYDDKITFNLIYKICDDEVIISGFEENKNCCLCIPCISTRKFFVVTNKEEV
jgi:hypothetical protein